MPEKPPALATFRDALAMIRDVLLIVVLAGMIALGANVAGRLDSWDPSAVPAVDLGEEPCLAEPC